MTPEALQALIRGRIPVADFMQLSVQSLQADQVIIEAPLDPNRNVHGTLFGGSGTAMSLVAAWSLVHARMQDEGLQAPLVVARQTTQYFRPVDGAVTARAVFENDESWADFTQALVQGRRARVNEVVELQQAGREVAARTEAVFAAVPAPT